MPFAPVSPGLPTASLRELFDQLAPMPAAARTAVLAGWAPDPSVLSRLNELLAHHDQLQRDEATGAGRQGFLAAGAVERLAQTASATVAPAGVGTQSAHPGQRLGAWEIVRLLGRGGMGEVYEARRADGQYDARAAIKLLRSGPGRDAVLRRFALERQALARLAHPNIARLLDAGSSEAGDPYFVMEHVEGRPIDEVALRRPLAARLAMFLQLAEAVAHAHRNLLVHRDLKPGNVLVDGDSRVRLLDFGIAKALDPSEDPTAARGAEGSAAVGLAAGSATVDATAGSTVAGSPASATGLGPRPYTPYYASPEQVRGQPVSTATDLYSLGVLLHEMLTGARPTGRHAKTAAAAAKSVLDEKPLPPSQLPAAEALDPQWVQTRPQLRGDLDAIVLKALTKDPAQRYASAEAFAADVRAVLERRPVAARTAHPGYVTLRFVQRNRASAAAAGLGAAGLIAAQAAALGRGEWLGPLGWAAAAGGLVLALVQAARAERARRAVEQRNVSLQSLAREVVAGYGDLVTQLPGGRERQARLLATTIEPLEQVLQHDGGRPSGLVAELGALHARLAHLRVSGEFNASEDLEGAETHARRASALLAEADASATLKPELRVAWALAHGDLARAAQRRGELDAAMAELDAGERALDAVPALVGASVAAVDSAGATRGGEFAALVRAQASLAMLRFGLHYGWDKPNRGAPDAARAELQRAQALYQGLVDAARAAGVDPDFNDVFGMGTAASSHSLVLARLGRRPEALDAARLSFTWREQALALAPHNRTVQGGLAADRNMLAGLSLELGDPAGALQASAPGWAEVERLIAEDPGHQTWINQRRWLAFHHGRALLALGRADEALPVLEVSAAWLEALVDAGQAAPRQMVRLARTWLAMARAVTAAGSPSPSRTAPDLQARALALLGPLAAAGDAEAKAALSEADASPQAPAELPGSLVGEVPAQPEGRSAEQHQHGA